MADVQQHLIWIGAGEAKQPALHFENYNKVTLIDAREEACLALQTLYNGDNIQVQQQAIAVTAGPVSLQRYNLPEFAALSAATGLKQFFPGLKATQVENITSKSISDLISKLELSGDSHTLVIDTPAQALEQLQTLVKENQLACFQQIYLPYSPVELYQGMAPFEQITALLAKHYYQLGAIDNADPDLPIYSFTLDANVKKLAQLNHEVKSLTEQLAVAKGQLTQAQQQGLEKKQLEQQKTELSKQLEDVKQQQAAEKQQLEQQKTELSKQLEDVKQQQAAEKQQLEQQKAELSKQLDTVKQQQAAEKQQLEQQKTELSKQLEAVKQHKLSEKEQFELQITDLSKQLAEKQHYLTEHEKWNRKLQQDVQQFDQTTAEFQLRITELTDALEAEKVLVQKLNAEIELSSTVNAQLETEYQQQLKQAEQASESKFEEFTSQINSLNQLLAEKQSYLTEHEQWNQKLQQQVESDKAELTSLAEKIAVLNELLKQRDDEFIGLQSAWQSKEQEFTVVEDQLNRRLDKTSAELEEYKKWNGGLKNQLTEKDKQIQQLQAAQLTLETQLHDKDNILHDSSNQLNELTQQIQKYKENIALAGKQHAELLEQLGLLEKEKLHEAHWNKEHKKWAEGLQQQLNSAKTEIDKIRKQLDSQQKTIELQAKLLSKNEVDSNDLRQKLASSKAKEYELLELIKELHQKLSMAAGFYHQLKLEHPELVVKE